MGRTFRVFVSSTFADLKEERNALQERVFPRLQAFCRQHGARFQAIDLRWGVSSEAARDQQTINICLDEVKRCQEASPRPNFVVLLGERYGWQPPPPQIPADEFDALVARVADAEARAELEHWYPLDENAVPAERYLRPRAGEYDDDDVWAPVERRLRATLEGAVEAMPLEVADRRKYETSATEQEIQRGALFALEDHVLCYFRTFDFGGRAPHHAQLKDFVDIDAAGMPDRAAAARLAHLKAELRRLPAENVHEYTATWTGNTPVPFTTDHLDQLCDDVYDGLLRIITAELAAAEAIDPLEQEIDSHRAFGEHRARFFSGRQDVLQQIGAYVTQPTGRPLALIGPPGSGKSAVMAHAARQASHGSNEVVVRFIGTSPDSSNGRALLDGLCREISRRFSADESSIPNEYHDLAADLLLRIGLASAERPLVLFLDAVDQFAELDPGATLSWLPAELPPHVALIVSALDGDSQRLVARRVPESTHVPLGPMARSEAVTLLDAWLADVGRTIQPAQQDAVLRQFAVEGRPLWLKVAFDEARRWRSDHTDIDLPPTVPGIMDRLFDRLDDPAQHGEAIVSRGLGYLAAARHGLSEDELIDMLSLGGTEGPVLSDLRRRSPKSPAVQRLPVILWSRLHADLHPYLTETAADGAALLTFYDRQFADAVWARYLADEGRGRHRELAGYFDEQELDRGAPNLRKLSELPFQQTEGGLWDDLVATLTDFEFLESKATHSAIFDVRDDFALALARLAENDGPHENVSVLRDYQRALTVESHSLRERPDLLWQQVFNELQEAGPLTQASFAPELGRRSEAGAPAWIRRTPLPRSVELIATLSGHRGWVIACAVSPDGRFVLAGDADGAVKLWDVERGTFVRDVLRRERGGVDFAVSADWSVLVARGAAWNMETGTQVRTLPGACSPYGIGGDGRLVVSGAAEHQLQLWDAASGEPLVALGGAGYSAATCAVSDDGRSVVSGVNVEAGLVEPGWGVLTVWDAQTGATRWSVRTEPKEGGFTACAISPDGRLLATGGDDGRVRTWHLETGAEGPAFTGHWAHNSNLGRVEACAFSPDGSVLVSASRDQTLRVLDPHDGSELRTLQGHGGPVSACAFSPDGRLIVSGGWDGTVRVWSAEAAPGSADREEGTAPHADLVTACVFAADGDVLASASWDATLKLWDSGERTVRRTIRTSPIPHNHVETCGAGPGWVVSAGLDGEVRLWDLESGAAITSFENRPSVAACDVSPDGLLVVTAHKDGLRVWDVQRAECRLTLEDQRRTRACALSPDGRLVATPYGVSEVDTGERVSTIKGAELSEAVAYSPDGRFIVTSGPPVSSRDLATITLWDPARGMELLTLRGHHGTVHACAVTPDASFVVSGGSDATVRVWAVEDGRCLATIVLVDAVRCVAVHPRQPIAVAGDDLGSVIWLDLIGVEYGA